MGQLITAAVARLAKSLPVSIRDFGGKDDGVGGAGSNNLSAFRGALEKLNRQGGGVLKLPRMGTGNYYVLGDDALTVDYPVEIDADPGVSITLSYGGGAHPLSSANLRSRRELMRVQGNFGFTNFYGGMQGKRLGETLPTVNNSDGVLAIPKVVSGEKFKVYRLVDIKNEVAPISAVGDSITYAGAGLPTMAVIPARAGKELHSLISSNAGGKFTAGVLMVNGWAWFEMNTANGAITLSEQETGLPAIFQGVNYHLMGQLRDYFNSALMTVKVNSARSFTVMVNGLAIGTVNTRSAIVAAGFGTTNIDDNVSLSQMFETVGNGAAGAKPLRLIVCGDSITDNAVQYSHAKYLANILGTAGVQIEQVLNLAKAGENAAQQYVRLQAMGAGADYCLIQVGVNDVQGLTNFAAFVTTITNMVTYAKNNGAIPIVAIPTGFYSKAEANAHGQAGGQDTTNNTAMRTYRALLARAVAAAGGLLNMETVKGFGPITASLLDMTPYAANDRMLVDNIHPTPYSSMMLAHGWARCILGHINQPDMSQFDDFEAIPAPWISAGYGTAKVPTIRGRELRGVLSLHATLPNEGAVAMQLPAYVVSGLVEMRQVTCLNAANNPVGVCTMSIGADGKLYFFNLPAGSTQVAVDGVKL